MNNGEIAIIALTIVGLMLEAYRHGKPKEGKHNIWIHLIALAIGYSLYYWAGLFH